MSQVSYGTIAITDLTDIKDMYLQYCMVVDSITTAAAIEAKTTWTSPEVNWFTLTADTTVNSNKRYYRLSSGNYYVITPIGSENPSSNGWYEDTVYPSWQSGYQIWIREVRIKEGIELPEYGTPYLDKAVNQINTRIKKIWSNSTGSYMASGIGGNDVKESDVSTYGFNSKSTTTGVSFNYNAIPLTSLRTDGIKIYNFKTTEDVITESEKALTIDTKGMNLFLPTNLITSLVSFGSTTRIGYPTSQHIEIKENGFNYTDGSSYCFFVGSEEKKDDGNTIVQEEFTEDYHNIRSDNVAILNSNSWDVVSIDQANIKDTFHVEETTQVFNCSNNIDSIVECKWYDSGYSTYITDFSTDNNTITLNTPLVPTSTNCYLYVTYVTTGVYDFTHSKPYLTFNNITEAPFEILRIKYTKSRALNYLTYGNRRNDIYNKGNFSIAMGSQNMALGEYSGTFGINNIATREASFAIGIGNNSLSYGTFVAGVQNTAIGECAIALGYESKASGESSIAVGYKLIANGENQTVFGKYNKADSNAMLIIGNGSSDSNRSNLFVVDENGNLEVKDGFKIINDTGNYLQLSTNNMQIWQKLEGASASVKVAEFGVSGAQIGQSSSSHSVIDAKGQRFYGGSNGTTQLANIGYDEGVAQIGTTTAPYYTFGVRKTTTTAYSPSSTYAVGDVCVYDEKVYVCIHAITTPESWDASHWQYYIGNYSVAEGLNTIASGVYSHAEGSDTTASGNYSHAEGVRTIASGVYSHAGGYHTTASGNYSHAEGVRTIASGNYSHAEGMNTIASGVYSHAEDSDTTASGNYSHAEGWGTIASGSNSHSQNRMTIAAKSSQTALGTYNIEDASDTTTHPSGTTSYGQYAVIVGNGTSSDARSNALTVDWDGNVDAAGSIISDANYEDAWHDSTQGYTVSGVSLAGSTYLGQAIRLEKVSATKKHPIFNGFDISGTGTARIHTLGHYIYKATYNGEQYWYAYIKMRNDNTSAINNSDVTAYIAWI